MRHIRESLEESKTRITELIFTINQEITHSWSAKEIMYVDAYFAFLRHQADILIKPEKKSVLYQQEQQIREYLSKLLGCDKNTEFIVMMKQIQAAVLERLHELEQYKSQIVKESHRYVYHTSAVKDLVCLYASQKKKTCIIMKWWMRCLGQQIMISWFYIWDGQLPVECMLSKMVGFVYIPRIQRTDFVEKT